MANTILSDDALRAAKTALNGLALRSEMIGRNVANVDTPGYKATQVNFESELAREMSGVKKVKLQTTQPGHRQSGDSSVAIQTEPRPGGTDRADGNNVDIDVELAQLTETGIRYQALIQLVGRKISLLRSIAQGR